METQPSEQCGRAANKISAVTAVQVLRPLALIQRIQRQCFHFSLMINFCSGFSDNCVQEQLIAKRGCIFLLLLVLRALQNNTIPDFNKELISDDVSTILLIFCGNMYRF